MGKNEKIPDDYQDVVREFRSFIDQRPNISSYNHSPSDLRATQRRVASDKDRAHDALRTFARHCNTHGLNKETLDYALSDRLTFGKDGKLDYIVGGYFPVEYRRAAANALETYVSVREREEAQNPQTSPSRLSELASRDGDHARFVRREVAENPKTPVGTVEALAFDKEPIVRKAIIARADVPMDVLATIKTRPALQKDGVGVALEQRERGMSSHEQLEFKTAIAMAKGQIPRLVVASPEVAGNQVAAREKCAFDLGVNPREDRSRGAER